MTSPPSGPSEPPGQEKRYLREIEKRFLHRRGSPLLLSPRDWALAVSWFESGVPLSLVLSGIDEVFDRLEERGEARRIRTLSFCAPAVDEAWRIFTEQPGATRVAPSRSERREGRSERLAALLREAAAAVSAASTIGGEAGDRLLAAAGTIEKASNDLPKARGDDRRRIESALGRLDGEIACALRQGCPREELAAARESATRKLEPHKSHMTGAIYRATLERAVENRLREGRGLPRLSLLLLG